MVNLLDPSNVITRMFNAKKYDDMYKRRAAQQRGAYKHQKPNLTQIFTRSLSHAPAAAVLPLSWEAPLPTRRDRSWPRSFRCPPSRAV